jgi:UDP-2,3-diacylglucosamine pyrophosphatase LpxH
MNVKRILDVVVISDIHLGTYGCHAKELLRYLKSVHPKKLILNGDIIDIWNFRKSYFPPSHLKVINRILKMSNQGVEVIYITGNHDDFLRKYTDLKIGRLSVVNQYVLELNDCKHWVFHGDVFDATTSGSAKLLARLGGKGYDLLILLNRFINWCLQRLGRPKMRFSKKVKDGVKRAVSWIGDFEMKAAHMAIQQGFDVVICGHIHKQQDREIETESGRIRYLNSGDWVENLTALEYNRGRWNLYQFEESKFERFEENDQEVELSAVNMLQLLKLQHQKV